MDPSSPTEYQPCPLHFNDFRQLDHTKNCTIYSSLQQREEPVTLEELESLHAELMVLQEDVKGRIQLLQSETAVLNDWQVKRDYRKRKFSDSDHHVPTRPGRKQHPGHLDSTPINKRGKEDYASATARQIERPKLRKTGGGDTGDESQAQETVFPRTRSDVTDRFWQSVEPYCSDVTEEDMDALQEMHIPESQYFETPPLGQHYSRMWAMEDLSEERAESARLLGQKEEQWMGESEALMKEGGALARKASHGPLTQRLMAAFLDDPGGSYSKPLRQMNANQAHHVSPTTLEARIKEELISLGLLEPQEAKEGNDEDEILAELRKAQSELKNVMEFNQQQRQVLCSLAQAEMKRQKQLKQLEAADMEVFEHLKKFLAQRQRKRREPISQRDKEQAWKALEARERILKHLQLMETST